MARQRGGSWMADIRLPDGSRKRKAFSTQEEAELWEAEVNLAIRKGTPTPEARTGKAGKRDLSTLGSLLDHTIRTHWAGKRSADKSAVNARYVVNHFGRNHPVAEITTADLADMAADFAEDLGNSGATINRKLAAISKMLHLAKDAGVIDSVPKMPKRKEGEGRIRWLTDAEEAKMMAYWAMTGDAFTADFTVFLLDTGARAFSEACRLKWEDITSRGATFWMTKGGKPRTVPLSARAKDALARRKAAIPGSVGPFYGVDAEDLRSRWDRMRTHLGFHDVTPHTLRHTCCSRFVMAGVDLLRVKNWMGHAAIATTMRYAHLAPEALDGMAALLDDRSGKVLQFERRA